MTPTDRQRLQDRLAALDQESGDLSYIVSHDVGAVVRQMKGFMDLIVRDLDPAMTARQRDFVSVMTTAAESGQSMLAALAAYSQAQRHPLNPVDFSAGELFDSVARRLAPSMKDSSAKISIGPLGSIRGDRVLLLDAVARIVENAIVFSRPDHPPAIEIAPLADDTDWVVRITDNGIGLAADQLEKVFQMFYRLERRNPRAGVGAGLTIARRIFRRHGGEVRLIEWADGVCVEMRLPREGLEAGAAY